MILEGLIQVEINICKMPDINVSVHRLLQSFKSLSALLLSHYYILICFGETRHWNIMQDCLELIHLSFVVSP
jgi:hypothetical protein